MITRSKLKRLNEEGQRALNGFSQLTMHLAQYALLIATILRERPMWRRLADLVIAEDFSAARVMAQAHRDYLEAVEEGHEEQ
jgi:hypothetical protein